MRNEFCAWYRKLTFTPTTHFDLRVNMWYSLVIMFATLLCKQNTSVWRLECGCCQSCWLCVTMCDIGWLWVVVIRCGCITVAVVKVAAHSTEIEVDGSLIRGSGRSWGHIFLYCMVDRLWVSGYGCITTAVVETVSTDLRLDRDRSWRLGSGRAHTHDHTHNTLLSIGVSSLAAAVSAVEQPLVVCIRGSPSSSSNCIHETGFLATGKREIKFHAQDMDSRGVITNLVGVLPGSKTKTVRSHCPKVT